MSVITSVRIKRVSLNGGVSLYTAIRCCYGFGMFYFGRLITLHAETIICHLLFILSENNSKIEEIQGKVSQQEGNSIIIHKQLRLVNEGLA